MYSAGCPLLRMDYPSAYPQLERRVTNKWKLCPTKNRIALGNLVPALGQFKVMDKIPAVPAVRGAQLWMRPAEVPETLRHVVFNIERGQTLHETIDFLNMCPDLKNMDIIYANELDDGAVRSGNCNVGVTKSRNPSA